MCSLLGANRRYHRRLSFYYFSTKSSRKAPEESLVHQMVVAVAEQGLQLGIKRESILMDPSTYESVEDWQSCWQMQMIYICGQ